MLIIHPINESRHETITATHFINYFFRDKFMRHELSFADIKSRKITYTMSLIKSECIRYCAALRVLLNDSLRRITGMSQVSFTGTFCMNIPVDFYSQQLSG